MKHVISYRIQEILLFISVRDIKNIFNAVMMIDDGGGDGDDNDERNSIFSLLKFSNILFDVKYKYLFM